MTRRALAYAAAAIFLIAAALVSALVGAASLNPLGTVAAMLDKIPFVRLPSGLSPLDKAVLFQIRLPRIVLGAVVGGLLSVAGAGYQGVFRNPLVDSGMLGSSAGAGLGATVAVVYFGGIGPSAVPVAAFAGSLAGVAVGLFLTAAQTYVLQRSTQVLQQVYAWLLGSLSGASWQQVTEILPYAAVSVLVILAHGRHLDVLSVGDDEARALGMNPVLVRAIIVAACALAAASAVAVSGLIGFVGIVVPHVVRRFAGTSYRLVLPLSLLAGAGFLVLADTVARTVLSPAELPIGVVTALAGSPAFVWILRATRAVGT
ncbi:MAG TPA: iron ABC transporter permease [Trebonia sp.]